MGQGSGDCGQECVIPERIVVNLGRILLLFCRMWVMLVRFMMRAWIFEIRDRTLVAFWQDLGDVGSVDDFGMASCCFGPDSDCF